MKKEDVQVGGTYLAKVGARSVEVRIERENPKGGWEAKSVATGKPIRLKDPKFLRPASVAKEVATGVEVGERGGGTATPVKPRKRAATANREAAPREAREKPMSCLDAAAAVLKATGGPMNCKAMVEAMAEQKLWSSNAPTPAATLSSAILRELRKGESSRFKKVDRGQFEYQEPNGG